MFLQERLRELKGPVEVIPIEHFLYLGVKKKDCSFPHLVGVLVIPIIIGDLGVKIVYFVRDEWSFDLLSI